MVCTCRTGSCILLNFDYTWISYRVIFWLFPPCNSHNSTCLTFPSFLAALGEQVPLCGREATLQKFRDTFPGRLPLRHTQEISNTLSYQEVHRSPPPPPLGLDRSRTTHGRTQKVLHKKEKEFQVLSPPNSPRGQILIQSPKRHLPPALSGHSEKSQRWKA